MKQDYTISYRLDKRRAKASGKYPVKLQVFTASPRNQKLYSTTFELSEKEFNSIWNTVKPRTEFKEQRKDMQALFSKATNIADKLNPFTFEQFEKQLYRKAGDSINIGYNYTQVIQQLIKTKQIGTASTYELSQKSLKTYTEKSKKQNFDKLTFLDITTDWLKGYEFYMTEINGKSLTTVSMYLRTLRALFNAAIDAKDIEKELYPFGKRKYQMPASKNVKKVLTKEQLKILFHLKPETQEQEKAKAFWFFSYSCNGMNIKDIALLKFKHIKNGKFEFYRAKTKLTSKANLKPITVYLNDFAKEVIEIYGNSIKSPENYVFDIIRKGLTPQRQQASIKNFTRFINQHLKKLCIANELPSDISTYWARHSFATNSINKGASMEFIQESLGHENLKTTQNYFAGFDNEAKRLFSETIMDFTSE